MRRSDTSRFTLFVKKFAELQTRNPLAVAANGVYFVPAPHSTYERALPVLIKNLGLRLSFLALLLATEMHYGFYCENCSKKGNN